MKTSIFRAPRVVVVLSIALLAVLSCQKNNSRTNGAGANKVNIFLTDDPALSFDHLFVDIRKVEVKVEDNSEDHHETHGEGDNSGHGNGDDNGHGNGDNGGHGNGGDDHGGDNHGQGGGDDPDGHGDTSGGWISLTIRPGIYDILNFRNGLDTLLASGDLSSIRTIRKVRLTLGNNNSVVVNGVTTPLPLSGNDNIIVIKLSDDFLDDNPADIRFTLDLDAGNSIRLHGNRLEFRPKLKAFRKERSGSIEGRVLPAQAQAVVMAFNGTDTATAKPEREGEFKIVGLKAGSYTVLVHATSGAYRDTSLTNVVVAGREDTHIGMITLHP